ncbi:MAG: hypothetical protein ACXQTV_04455 [Candidatus Hecatellaceae archaeon]
MGEGWLVKLEVDGKPIPLSPFVQKFLGSTIAGMVSALKGVPAGFKKASIMVEKPSEE